jgi:hypothetical protein
MMRNLSDLLVSSRVLDNAAKHVMRIGPKIGWKLSAWPKLRNVLPNQTWTMSQAVDLRLHVPAAAESVSV